METEEKLNNWSLWCRLCAKNDPTTNMNIFLKDESPTKTDVTLGTITTHIDLNIVAAMEKFFFVNVKRDEELPKVLCLECYALTTSLLEFAERVVKVQRMFEMIQKSTSERCSNLDLQAMRVKHELFDANRIHIVMNVPEPEVHYLELQSRLRQLENPITNADTNTMDPLEFAEVEVKIEKPESHVDVDDSIDTGSTSNNNKLKIANIEDIGQVSTPNKLVEPLPPLKEIASKKHKSNQPTRKNDCSNNEKKFTVNLSNSEEGDSDTFNCTECPRKFKRERDYHFHLKHTHKKDVMKYKQFTCPECSRNFATRGRLKQHAELHLPLELRKTFACDMCEQKFISNFNLQSHIKIVHMKLHNNFVCEECGTVAHSKGTLQSHLLTHTKSTPHACKVCGNAFKSTKSLKRHMEIHNAKIMCPECGLQLSSKSTLSRHLLVHSDEMKHKCEQCGRAFKTVKTLKNHLITHTGLRPYTCEFCNQTFSFGSSCRLHKKKLHPKELAELEASGAPKAYTRNIPKLAVLKAMTKAAGNVRTATSD